ncbi:hypothetical protein MBLNU459_g2179t1 [Dothideomycetes sp. NU459]
MAATGAISLVANVSAPVGLADVAFRAGKDIYEKLSKFRKVSREVDSLLSTIQRLETAIASVNLYLANFSRSEYVTHDRQPLPDMDPVLEGCASELTKLNIAISAVKITCSDDWSVQWLKKARYVLSEEEMMKSRHTLENYINALNLHLGANQGQNQIVLRQQLEATRADIDTAQSAIIQQTTTSSRMIQTYVADSSNIMKDAIVAGAQTTQFAVETSKNYISNAICSSIDSVRQDILTSSSEANQRLSGVVVAVDVVSKRAESSVNATVQTHECKSASRHASLKREIARSEKALERRIRSVRRGLKTNLQTDHAMARMQGVKLDQVQSDVKQLARFVASITITETADHGIQFEGTNIQAILPPLWSIRSDLTKALSRLSREGSMKISQGELAWLEDELENLIDAAYASRKRSRLSRTSTSESSTSPRSPSNNDRGTGKLVRNNFERLKNSSQMTTTRVVDSFAIKTPIGHIDISISRSSENQSATDCGSQTAIRFSFWPKQFSSEATIAIAATFLRQSHTQQIARQLLVWNVPEDASELIELVLDDNVSALSNKFGQGTASIYDCTKEGDSLLAVLPQFHYFHM